MNDNIEKVVDRGERLESLLDKTTELEVSVSIFIVNTGNLGYLPLIAVCVTILANTEMNLTCVPAQSI